MIDKPHIQCVVVSLALTALSACSQSNEIANEPYTAEAQLAAEKKFWRSPRYGEIKAVRGEVFQGFETSAIRLCEVDRESCVPPRNADGSEQWCWLTSYVPKDAPLDRPVGPDFTEGGEYWFEGDVRIAVRPGSFGHLGEYTCQVQIHNTRVLTKD